MVIAGWAAALGISWRMLARASARIRNESHKQIEALSTRVTDLEHTIAIARALRSPENAGKAAAAAASVAAVVSEKVMVQSAKKSQTLHPLGDPWAQQGRAGVQSSHDIALRGH